MKEIEGLGVMVKYRKSSTSSESVRIFDWATCDMVNKWQCKKDLLANTHLVIIFSLTVQKLC